MLTSNSCLNLILGEARKEMSIWSTLCRLLFEFEVLACYYVYCYYFIVVATIGACQKHSVLIPSHKELG